jgi:tRNA-Thr(GGU) m(6)t(6)A37 methyltransferase TsaA
VKKVNDFKKRFSVKPIGYVKEGTIILNRRWAAGLKGIDGFSHIIILYWLHKTHKPRLFVRPKNIKWLPRIGFLATRTPHRPNPVGFAVLKLMKRRGRRLWVEGIDAWNGTPILDIKPYTCRDTVVNHRIPAWVKTLDRMESDPLRRYGRCARKKKGPGKKASK